MNWIYESIKTDSNISTARLQQWFGFLIVAFIWLMQNIVSTIINIIAFFQHRSYDFKIVSFEVMVGLVIALITGKTIQSFSEK